MTKSIKATLIVLASLAMLAVTASAFAQRQGGGGGGARVQSGGGHGGGGHRHYQGGHRYHGGHHGGHHHHSRWSVGFAFGGWYPYSYWPGYYAYPAYPAYYPAYYPYAYPAAVGYSSPPVYIERDREVAAGDSPYWYYCRDSDTYYPYVKQCSGSWERVPAQPAR